MEGAAFSVVVSTVGRAHLFALARELERRDLLRAIYSGFPWAKLAREGVARRRVRTFPWVRPAVFGVKHLPAAVRGEAFDRLHLLSLQTLDGYARATLPPCDVFVGHEGVGLVSGAAAQRRGALYICDRGCSHIAWQRDVLSEEYERLGLAQPRATSSLQRELEEYERADHIVVPSGLARRSFLEKGVAASKLSVVGYGAELPQIDRRPAREGGRFQVLFAGQFGVRKAAFDVLTAFRRLEVPGKRLVIAGEVSAEIAQRFAPELRMEDVTAVGSVSRQRMRELMLESDVLVLPSIEDGFGMVVAEAAACGCPAIVSENTGAADFVQEGVNGHVVPIRSPDLITERLQRMAADAELRRQLSDGALQQVQALRGWGTYGDQMVAVFSSLLDTRLS